MIFETSSKHEFIDKQPMIILTAVTNQLHKIRMPKLSKKIHLRLHHKKSNKINKITTTNIKKKSKNNDTNAQAILDVLEVLLYSKL
jgi:hypothetical protein